MTEKLNLFARIKKWFKETIRWLFDFEDWKRLLRSIPSVVIAL